MTQPIILAFDTSGPHCATAVVMGDRVLATRFEEMAKGQAERLMPQIEATLADDGLPLEVLDAIAVGIGPGNFTGIRIAVSAARGLALALGIPAIGVSNFEVMRGPHSRKAMARQLVSLEGPRFGLFLQAFEKGRECGEPLLSPGLEAPFWEAFTNLADAEILGFLASDLAYFHPPTYEHSGPKPLERALPTPLSAQIIGQIAADKLAEDTDHPSPAPLYIKPADAAPSREQGPTLL